MLKRLILAAVLALATVGPTRADHEGLYLPDVTWECSGHGLCLPLTAPDEQLRWYFQGPWVWIGDLPKGGWHPDVGPSPNCDQEPGWLCDPPMWRTLDAANFDVPETASAIEVSIRFVMTNHGNSRCHMYVHGRDHGAPDDHPGRMIGPQQILTGWGDSFRGGAPDKMKLTDGEFDLRWAEDHRPGYGNCDHAMNVQVIGYWE